MYMCIQFKIWCYLQIATVDLDHPDDCLHKFKSNKDMGLVFLLFIIMSNLMKGTEIVEDESESQANESQKSEASSAISWHLFNSVCQLQCDTLYTVHTGCFYVGLSRANNACLYWYVQ